MRNTNHEMQNRLFTDNFLSGISYLDHQNEKMIYKKKMKKMNQQNAHCLCVFFLRLNYIYNIFTLYYACYMLVYSYYAEKDSVFLTITDMRITMFWSTRDCIFDSGV